MMERTGLVIATLERLNLSASGNPRFRVTFTDGTQAATEPDNSLNYGIENPEAKGPLTVTFTRNGRITRIVNEKGQVV
jgi:hypothetical protein